ncbi:helix-turn-helix domain-containing protein [Lentzea sp. NPDC059081]|uniref:helix-turn-helix domain-containing protein n=1 Tax=Lentzea sp. NPDC059081 TaxID=3346719 RepID=UPI0036B22A6B
MNASLQERAESPHGAVAKALRILGGLYASSRPLSLAELSRNTGLPKSTVHRLLGLLCEHDVVARSANEYCLAFASPLERAVHHEPNSLISVMKEESVPYLLDLHLATGGTATISVLVDNCVQHVHEVFRHGGARIEASRVTHSVVESSLRAYDVASQSAGAAGVDFANVRRSGSVKAVDSGKRLVAVAVPLCHTGTISLYPMSLSICARVDQIDQKRAEFELRQSSYVMARRFRRVLSQVSSGGRPLPLNRVDRSDVAAATVRAS